MLARKCYLPMFNVFPFKYSFSISRFSTQKFADFRRNAAKTFPTISLRRRQYSLNPRKCVEKPWLGPCGSIRETPARREPGRRHDGRSAKFRQNVARFRLYRHRFLQLNMRFAAFFKIYQIFKLKFLKFGNILQILRHLRNFC